MKKVIAYYCIFFTVFYGYSAEKSNRVYFTLNSKNTRIIIPVTITDSIVANMFFDTGAGASEFNLDSAFCVAHPSILLNRTPNLVKRWGSGWVEKIVSASCYNMNQEVKIGSAVFNYQSTNVVNLRKFINNPEVNGIICIPKVDSIHVWELNFENNYIEVHLTNDFKMPENCFRLPMVRDKSNLESINVKIPLKIKCADGDTLTVNRLFDVDTGMSWDIALMYNAEELPFFNQKEGVWMKDFANSYFRYYKVDAMLSNNFFMDSMRIYTLNYRNSIQIKRLVGLNFLKRFNVFFDLKNRQMGLQPIRNFQRISNSDYKQFYLSLDKTPQGKYCVKEVGDYKSNTYKIAGFRKGDEVVKMNGKLFKDLTAADRLEMSKKDTLIYDIVRRGKLMKIVVKVDKNRIIGD